MAAGRLDQDSRVLLTSLDTIPSRSVELSITPDHREIYIHNADRIWQELFKPLQDEGVFAEFNYNSVKVPTVLHAIKAKFLSKPGEEAFSQDDLTYITETLRSKGCDVSLRLMTKAKPMPLYLGLGLVWFDVDTEDSVAFRERLETVPALKACFDAQPYASGEYHKVTKRDGSILTVEDIALLDRHGLNTRDDRPEVDVYSVIR